VAARKLESDFEIVPGKLVTAAVAASRPPNGMSPCQLGGVSRGEADGLLEPSVSTVVATSQHLDVAELAGCPCTDLRVANLCRSICGFVQEPGRLAIEAPHAVDERGAEGHEGSGPQARVIGHFGHRHRVPQEPNPGFARSRCHGRLSRLEAGRRRRTHPARPARGGRWRLGCRTKRRPGLGPELARDEVDRLALLVLGCLRVTRCCKRPDEEFLTALVEWIAIDEPPRELDRASSVAGCEPSVHALAEDRRCRSGQASALANEPDLVDGARIDGDAREQLACLGERLEALAPFTSSQLPDVNCGLGRELDLDGITADRDIRAERPAQLGEVPAEGAEGVVGVPEQELGELLPGHGVCRQQEVGEKPPGLVSARPSERSVLAANRGRAEQPDAGPGLRA
jgi:hypothetical protein